MFVMSTNAIVVANLTMNDRGLSARRDAQELWDCSRTPIYSKFNVRSNQKHRDDIKAQHSRQVGGVVVVTFPVDALP